MSDIDRKELQLEEVWLPSASQAFLCGVAFILFLAILSIMGVSL